MDFTIDIACPVEQVFTLIADLPKYQEWLPPSGLYAGSTVASDSPIKLGTTYLDHSKQATLHGRVTAFEPPHALAFHQETGLALGRLIVDIQYRLEPLGDGTRVHRTTAPRLTGVLALLGPVIVRSIRAENTRTLATMKQHLESRSGA
jgi:carbon monoxide dehydrogenase subunit G